MAIIFPLLGLKGNEYVFIDSFPYGSYVHSSIAIANSIFKIFLYIGFLGLVIGLIKPEFVYFGQYTNRKNVIIFYGYMLILAFLLYKSMPYLHERTAIRKKPELIDFYKKIVVGEEAKLLISKIGNLKYKLQWQVNSSSTFNNVLGFPYKNPDQLIMQIHFPGFNEENIIAVEISDQPDNAQSKVLRAIFIENDQVKYSIPEVNDSYPKIMQGSFLEENGVISFLSCNGDEILVDLSITKDEMFNYHRQNSDKSKRVFSIFSGAMIKAPACPECDDTIDLIYVYEIFSLKDDRVQGCYLFID